MVGTCVYALKAMLKSPPFDLFFIFFQFRYLLISCRSYFKSEAGAIALGATVHHRCGVKKNELIKRFEFQVFNFF